MRARWSSVSTSAHYLPFHSQPRPPSASTARRACLDHTLDVSNSACSLSSNTYSSSLTLSVIVYVPISTIALPQFQHLAPLPSNAVHQQHCRHRQASLPSTPLTRTDRHKGDVECSAIFHTLSLARSAIPSGETQWTNVGGRSRVRRPVTGKGKVRRLSDVTPQHNQSQSVHGSRLCSFSSSNSPPFPVFSASTLSPHLSGQCDTACLEG